MLLLFLLLNGVSGSIRFFETKNDTGELKNVIFKNNIETTTPPPPISAPVYTWNHTVLPACMTPLFYFTSDLVGIYKKNTTYFCVTGNYYFYTFARRKQTFPADITSNLPHTLFVGGLVKKNDKIIKYLRAPDRDKEHLEVTDCISPKYKISVYIYDTDYNPRSIWGKESFL